MLMRKNINTANLSLKIVLIIFMLINILDYLEENKLEYEGLRIMALLKFF